MAHLVTWLVTGLIAGWIIRTATRTGRDFGLIGDLVTGSLGATIGGWLWRAMHVTTPDGLAGHVIAALVGATALLAALRALRHAWVGSPLGAPVGAAPGTLDLHGQIERLSALERQVFGAILGRQPVSRDPNTTFDTGLTFGQRAADRVAVFGGSWAFIGLFLVTMMAWITLNAEVPRPFDPYPFILLNLVLSCLAALQAPIIMMSQNRMAVRDRLDARSDYEVNLRAEMEIMALHAKLDSARDQELAALVRLASAQGDLLARLEDMLRATHEDATH